jgi:hypothetical protein
MLWAKGPDPLAYSPQLKKGEPRDSPAHPFNPSGKVVKSIPQTAGSA